MLFHYIWYLLLGGLAGFLAGLLGIGGGAVVVPGLATIFTYVHMPANAIMHMAAATSLAAMILTTITAVYTQQKQKNILWDLFRQLAPGLALGTFAGVFIAGFLPTHFLKILFAVFLLFTGLKMLIGKKHSAESLQPPSRLVQTASGLAIGLLSGILGIGGGAFIVPLLLRFGVDPHKTAATSSACAFLLAIVGTICFMISTGMQHIALPPGSTGFVYWPAAIALSLTSMLLVPIGTKFAKRLSGDNLKKVFAVFLLIIGVDMLV